MQQQRGVVRRSIAALVLATFLGAVLAAPGQAATRASAARPGPSEPHAPQGGEAVFRGIFFGEGVVGQMLPEVWHGKSAVELARTPEQAARTRRFEETLIAQLKRNDPKFLDQFGAAMQSGDHLVIQAALHDMASKAATVLKASPEVAKVVQADATAAMRGNTLEYDYNLQYESNIQIQFDLQVQLFIEVAEFLVVVLVAEQLGTPQPAVPAATPSLKRDQLIDVIARNLAAP